MIINSTLTFLKTPLISINNDYKLLKVVVAAEEENQNPNLVPAKDKFLPSKVFYEGFDYTVNNKVDKINSKGNYVGYYRCAMRRSQSCEGKITYTINEATKKKTIEVTREHVSNCAAYHIKV